MAFSESIKKIGIPNMFKVNFTILLSLLLSSCQLNDPGNQCLDSFRLKLKDPDSGKVVSFEAPTLIYTATNAYGGRVQGRALCRKVNDKWVRDYSKEYLEILDGAISKLKASNNCRKAGGKAIDCAGDSLALKSSAIRLGPVDEKMLEQETAKELGFD